MLKLQKINSWFNLNDAVGICAFFCGLTFSCTAADWRLESVGARGGFSANDSGTDFYIAESFLNVDMPWGWNLGSTNWHLQSRLDYSIGWLGHSADNALVTTLGPSLVLTWTKLPLSLEGGVSPTLLSQSDFGSKDFGIPFQFTSHAGLNWDFASHFRLGYRYQHMSNASLSSHNPGLNMHLFGLSYLF